MSNTTHRYIAAEYVTDIHPRQLVTTWRGTWTEVAEWVSNRLLQGVATRRRMEYGNAQMDEEAETALQLLARPHTTWVPVRSYCGHLVEYEIISEPAAELPVPVEQLADWWQQEPLRRALRAERIPSTRLDLVRTWLWKRVDTLPASQRGDYADPAVQRALHALGQIHAIRRDLPAVDDVLDEDLVDHWVWTCTMAERLLADSADTELIDRRAAEAREHVAQRLAEIGANQAS